MNRRISGQSQRTRPTDAASEADTNDGTVFDRDEIAGRSATASANAGDRPDGEGSSDDAEPFDARDPEAERRRVRTFIDSEVTAADADGVVVNMSGGLDSTVTAALAVEALGPERVYALILPCNKIGAPHARDAEALADALGIEHNTVHLQPLFAQFGAVAPDRFDLHDEPVRSGNAVSRLRMTMAYLAANATNRLVCGTTNRSELLLGYFTKHGDGGADLLPLGHLYKTEVRALAAALDVPSFVTEKPPSAGFLPGQRDADDLGAPYDVIDRVLRLGVDRGMEPEAISERIDTRLTDGDDSLSTGEGEPPSGKGDPPTGDDPAIDAETVTRLLDRYRETAHKRVPPPIPGRPGR